MKQEKQLAKDLTNFCRENHIVQAFQLGGFVICPIFYGEDDGVIEVDRESMEEEMLNAIDSVNFVYMDEEDYEDLDSI